MMTDICEPMPVERTPKPEVSANVSLSSETAAKCISELTKENAQMKTVIASQEEQLNAHVKLEVKLREQRDNLNTLLEESQCKNTSLSTQMASLYRTSRLNDLVICVWIVIFVLFYK